MRRNMFALFTASLVAVGLSSCSTFFQGGVMVGGPTVWVTRENFSYTVETDSNNNTFHVYSYDIVLYAQPGSGAGYVILLDSAGNSLESPFLIPSSCPGGRADPCGPFIWPVYKKVSAPLSPVQAVKYRSVGPDGQAKEVPLPVPIELY